MKQAQERGVKVALMLNVGSLGREPLEVQDVMIMECKMNEVAGEISQEIQG